MFSWLSLDTDLLLVPDFKHLIWGWWSIFDSSQINIMNMMGYVGKIVFVP